MSLWTQKTVNLDPSFDLHGNFCPWLVYSKNRHFGMNLGSFLNEFGVVLGPSQKYFSNICKHFPTVFDDTYHHISLYFLHFRKKYGDVYFVRFLRIQLYKIIQKLLQNVFCRDSCTFFRYGQKVSMEIKTWIQIDSFLVS